MSCCKIFDKPMKKTPESFTKLTLAFTCLSELLQIYVVTCWWRNLCKPYFEVVKSNKEWIQSRDYFKLCFDEMLVFWFGTQLYEDSKNVWSAVSPRVIPWFDLWIWTVCLFFHVVNLLSFFTHQINNYLFSRNFFLFFIKI